ncbi:biotin--[acetyl-CoA-carboxylase] ligase [Helicobacter sp. 23-1045]
MQIKFFDSLPSTQKYLIAQIKSGAVDSPLCIVAKAQNAGIGSRGNEWRQVEKGLYFSFALPLDLLPQDLQVQSSAIFFAFNFMRELRDLGSAIWLKYPNDLFLGHKKIGGVMCGIAGNFAVCGIGLNLEAQKFAHLESNVSAILQGDLNGFLSAFFKRVESAFWSEVFSAYSAEFHKNYDFSFHSENGKILSLKNATLQKDGAIKVGGKLIYSTRDSAKL